MDSPQEDYFLENKEIPTEIIYDGQKPKHQQVKGEWEMYSHKRGIYVDKECLGGLSKNHKKCIHERKSQRLCASPKVTVVQYSAFFPSAFFPGLRNTGYQMRDSYETRKRGRKINKRIISQSCSLPLL